jgi:hypothetical protein
VLGGLAAGCRIALIRRQEVVGFIQNLFGKEQSLTRPPRALEALAEAGALFGGVYEVAGNPAKPVSADDIVETRRHIRELTKIAERDIHEVVLSCTRVRRRTPCRLRSQPCTDAYPGPG